ncbi:serine hydrolase [Desulfuribacillus stibiiarsenatis]|uniref:Serine hydrolase n=1 Tax=Desulfuribacillus stibiiarsenatis TaxID=1390249 RepID=A0A1E5L8P0_9FIRM|nr:serine hydrolase domain-containing protein [Desulfuribacillus stibiiarsenatis]OEH86394.1 serine hydrolase [Desulfuribacillus stibiiarsenatis]
MFKPIKILSISLLLQITLTITTTVGFANSFEGNDIEAFFDKTMHAQITKHNIPNATISVVKDGEIVYKKGFGYADIASKIPVDPDTTLFRIGSTSKLFTWTAVMQLVEDGKLDLNADVNKYLDFEIPPHLVSVSKKITEPITLTHLMTHTPGFEDYPDKLFRLSADELLPLNEYIKEYMPARIFPPGEVATYSNYGTALAGYIVERISGLPFSEYVEKNIFIPLKMDRSTFKQLETLSLAKPYRFVDGTYLQGNMEYILPEPAGSMSSTGLEMAGFMIAHLNGVYNGERILKQETLKQMHEQQFTHHPILGGMTLGFMEGAFNEKKVIFHGGGTMLYSTGLYLVPEENVGIFISYSGANHFLHSEVFQDFLDIYYPIKAQLKQLPPEGSLNRAKKFIGEYQMNRRSITTSEKSTSLFIGKIQVDVDEEGYLLVNNLGETNKFIEVEPGVYQRLREGRTYDYFGPFNNIVFTRDHDGRIMLTSDGPMTYSKAPIYSTTNFTVFGLILIIFILISSLTYWIIARIIGLFRKSRQSGKEVVAQGIGICSVIVVMIIIANILSSGDIDPIYQLPKAAYIPMNTGPMLAFLPTLVPMFASILAFFTTIAWWNGYWRTLARIHYTLFTLAYFGLFLIANYWNLFK